MSSPLQPVTPVRKPLFARTVARALTKVLEAANTSIHWINVVGESSLDDNPTLLWPIETDPMFNVMVQFGWSEGTLLYVYAQDSRYRPEKVVPLLQIKMLGSMRTVCADVPIVMNFLDQIRDNLFEPEPPQEVLSKQV